MADNSDLTSTSDRDSPRDPFGPSDARNAESAVPTASEAGPDPKQESAMEALSRLHGGSGAAPDPASVPASPRSSATGSGKAAEPSIYSAVHPDGGLVAMRLLSRMQTDLAVLTHQRSKLQANLGTSQRNFLAPKIKPEKTKAK